MRRAMRFSPEDNVIQSPENFQSLPPLPSNPLLLIVQCFILGREQPELNLVAENAPFISFGGEGSFCNQISVYSRSGRCSLLLACKRGVGILCFPRTVFGTGAKGLDRGAII